MRMLIPTTETGMHDTELSDSQESVITLAKMIHK